MRWICASVGRVAEAIPEPLRAALAPALEIIDQVNEQIYACDGTLEHWALTRYPESARLTQVNGVGTLTALAQECRPQTAAGASARARRVPTSPVCGRSAQKRTAPAPLSESGRQDDSGENV